MPQATAEKLGVRAGASVLVLGQPVGEAERLLGTIPDGATLTATATEPCAIVLLFADTVADVRANARSAFGASASDGRLWIAYRKGAHRGALPGDEPALHRDTLQKALSEVSLDGVTLISLDDTWSAMRIKAV